jgi:uncharacterized OB-fold protein
MSYDKPLPVINSDNQHFWEGCHLHELRFQQCSDCGHVRWPPAIICPECHSSESKWLVSNGIGKVYTFVVYHTLYHTGFITDLPYVVAVVALEEGPHLLTNIVDCRSEDVTCDMPVQVAWDDVTDEVTLPKFKPL